ncbi:zinc ion binding [Sparganum proliferum]
MLHNHEACRAAPEEKKKKKKQGGEHAPPAYEVLEDLTPEFVRFLPSDRMDSYEALNERLRHFQQAMGSVYVLGRSNNWSQKKRESAATAGLTYKNVTLQCVHFGSGNIGSLSDNNGARFKSTVKEFADYYFSNLILPRSLFNSRTVRIGCKSRIYVSSVRGGVELVSFDMRHNHKSATVSQEAAKLIAKNIDNFALWRYL